MKVIRDRNFITRAREQLDAEATAHDMVLPLLGELVQEMDVMPYITAPIVSDSTWDAFVDGLEVFEGHSALPALRAGETAQLQHEVVRSHL